MKIICLTISLLLSYIFAFAAKHPLSVISPNGDLEVTINLSDKVYFTASF